MSVQSVTPMTNSRWIWPFEILEQIGEGGMGKVYRARYVVNDRHVALKMLPADVTEKTALARFERELEVLKTLRHENIVRCFGGVSEDKRRFYAMELVEGGSLEDELQRRGKLPWEAVVDYGLQMCAALEASHQKGVVHRDVKPSNFLLTREGRVKLSDFGLASVVAARKITAAGKTAGTFLYMAPEQIRGQELSARTDLYALGCVLYELVTGHVPFIGETPAATLHMHCSTPPRRPTELALDCPVQLERLILKLMAKDPEDRYASAVEVARDLKQLRQPMVVVKEPAEAMERIAKATERVKQSTPKLRPPVIPKVEVTVTSKWAWVLGIALVLSLLGNFMLLSTGETGGQWREHWVQAANSPSPEVREAAAAALGEHGARDEESRLLLEQGLTHPDPRVRVASIRGLEQTGGAAKNTLPTLLKIQNLDENETVRGAARMAAHRIKEAPVVGRFPWGVLLAGLLFAAAGVLGVLFWSRVSPSA